MKISAMFMVVIYLLCGGTILAAEQAPNRGVRAGIFNFDGYHMKDGSGRLEGYGIDLLGLISEYSHLNFIFSGYDKSWHDMQEMLKNGQIDIVTSARRTPEREELFAYSLPVGKNSTVLTARISNSDLRPGEYATYDGMTVGEIEGSSQNGKLEDFARMKGFSYKARRYDSPEQLAQALHEGEVDAILSSNLRKAAGEKVLDVINTDNFHVIARKENQKLIDEINYAIEQMNLNEGDWQNDLYYRYYGPKHDGHLDFTKREKAYIDAVVSGKKKITAIARGDTEPYSYIENGRLKGILPDYFARIMQIAGLPYELVVPESDSDYNTRSENNGITVTLDRLHPQALRETDIHRGFTTDAYMNTGLARVTRQGFSGPVKKAAVVGSIGQDISRAALGDAEIKRYSSSDEAMRAVSAGDADAAYVFPYAAQIFINKDPANTLYYTMMNDNGAGFRMYVPETADHELISILNKSIRNVPEGTLNQLSSHYTSFSVGNLTVAEYLRANPGVTFACALAIALGSSIIGILLLRGHWNRRLLEAADKSNRELEGQLSIVEALSRDYVNVFALNEDRAAVRIVKLQGHVPAALVAGEQGEQAYQPVLDAYVRDRVHPGDKNYVAKALGLETISARLATAPVYTGSYRLLIDGTTHYYQFTCVNIRRNGGLDGAFILAGFRNIDEMIKREREQKAALREALAQARYANAAKTSFLNNMSHDIRTPMNAIIGFTALASKHIENTTQVRGYLGKIMTSGNHLLSLINDVLDMSRIESGKVKIEEKETSLPDIIHDLRTIVQADVKARQLNFQIDTLDVVNEVIFCDRLRLNQVLLNILSNAIKYTPPGGTVGVHVIQREQATDDTAAFEFRIKDNGIGMSPEFLAHVFEPFEREQSSTVSGIQGTGLGLAITKNIVDMMGGSIGVESEPGKGSEFTVSLRFRVADGGNMEAIPARFAGMRALIVDDDIDTCTSVAKMLSGLGLRPDWTTLGREAMVRMQFAIEQKDDYGVFFVDWMMPDMNGIELARRLRKSIGDEIPVIILTAYDWGDIEDEAREAGVTAFCSKPVFLSELRSLLADPAHAHAGGDDAPVNTDIFIGKSILLAEDNEMNQEIAQMILEGAGFKLDIVENGAMAVEKMEKMPPGTYDLILMDVQMPIMNGYEATRRIRVLADSAKAQIPIVAMTANAFAEDRKEALEAGMNGYISKPINIGELMRGLEKILNHGNLHNIEHLPE